MEGPIFWICAILAVITVGAGKGGLPVIGMLGVPILSIAMNPVAAAGLLLPIYVVSDLFGLWAYRGSFNRRVLAILAVGVTIGVGIGWATAHITPQWAVTVLVGAIGAIFSLRLLTQKSVQNQKEPQIAPGIFWGTLTGFTSFISHAGAPPFQVYVLPLKLEKLVFAGTNTILFAYLNAIKLVPYWSLGQINLTNLKVAAFLVLPATIAVFAGRALVQKLPEKLFFQIVTYALLGVSVKLIWDGLRAMGG